MSKHIPTPEVFDYRPESSRELSAELAAIESSRPSRLGHRDFYNVPELPSLTQLTNHELRKLLCVVCSEGLKRGFVNYWWERP